MPLFPNPLMNLKLGHLSLDLGHAQAKTAAEGAFTVLSLFSLMLIGAYFKHMENARYPLAASVIVAHEFTLGEVPLEAKSAIVYDATTGKILFSKDSNDSLPLASLTKLMSTEAILALKNPNDDIEITQDDLAPDGDSGLRVGDVWTLKNLLTFGLIVSSNDAMQAAAAAAGTSSIISKMNETAAFLGLTQTHFTNPTGLDVDVEADEAGAYGSAHDMALLAADFLKRYPDFFNATVAGKTSIPLGEGSVTATPTASPLLDIPGLIGAKTGYTDLAGGNLVAAFDLEVGHPVIAVVLGSTYEGRFSDIRALIDATRKAAAHN